MNERGHMENELEPYKTSDTPLAAYLKMKGMTLLTTRQDPNDFKRQIFVFVDTLDRPTYEQEFLNDEGKFKTYFWALKSVQRVLFKDRGM